MKTLSSDIPQLFWTLGGFKEKKASTLMTIVQKMEIFVYTIIDEILRLEDE